MGWLQTFQSSSLLHCFSQSKLVMQCCQLALYAIFQKAYHMTLDAPDCRKNSIKEFVPSVGNMQQLLFH